MWKFKKIEYNEFLDWPPANELFLSFANQYCYFSHLVFILRHDLRSHGSGLDVLSPYLLKSTVPPLPYRPKVPLIEWFVKDVVPYLSISQRWCFRKPLLHNYDKEIAKKKYNISSTGQRNILYTNIEMHNIDTFYEK